jgi:hypothetical protein
MNDTTMNFDKQELFKKYAEPIMKQLVGVCSSYDIPMFFAACVSDNGEKSEYIKEIISPESHKIKLSQDVFSDLIAVTLGFTTVPPVEKISIEYEEATSDDAEDEE